MATETSPLTSSAPSSSASPQRAKRLALHAAGLVVVALAVVGGISIFRSSRAGSQSSPAAHIRTANSAPSFPGASDEIANLPGKPATYASCLFSGYLPLPNGGEGFYFLAESQSATPEQDPVLLWLNGGPGSSSLEGCFTENGPLLVQPGGKTVRVNDYAWNKHANMLCIESPIGVGFTYNASGIYKSDDVAQADDLYGMLQSFFTKFPWLRANDFIISGESYGGVYVPMTAKRIVEGNAASDAANKINLKKFVVGNGVNEFGTLSKVQFAYYHALASTEDYLKVAAACPQLQTPGARLPLDPSAACVEAISSFSQKLSEISVNPYGIYNKCDVSSREGAGSDDDPFGLLGPMQAVPRPLPLAGAPCISFADPSTFFNLPEVRTAMHTKTEVKRWSNALTTANFDLPSMFPNATAEELDAIIKNKLLDYTTSLHSEVTPIWKFLLAHGVEGVIYHGDTDMVCNFVGGLWAVESLQLPRKGERSVWTVPNDSQVAGFVEDFGAIKYVTVRGAGHLVPSDRPQEAEAMLLQFVLN